MTKGIRLAGHELGRDGRELTWIVADGERGRRWRELSVDPAAGVVRTLTLETGRGGGWLRLEVATAAGLLSLHPDRLGEIHGNVASSSGVRHLSLGVLSPALVEVPGSVAADAALCRGLESVLTVGEGSTVSVARVSEALEVSIEPLAVVRRAFRSWDLGGEDAARVVELDDHRVPVEAESRSRWPLEAPVVTPGVD